MEVRGRHRFKFTTWGSSDPQDGNFGFPEVCKEGRRLKVITASSSGSQTPISRSPAQRCPPGLRLGPAAREIRQPGKGRSHHSRGPRGDRANVAPHTGFLRAKASCGPQGGGHGHVSAEGRGWKWERADVKERMGRERTVGDDRAHGPSEERSPAALSSLPDSPHPSAAHLAPLARGENAHCAGEGGSGHSALPSPRRRPRARFQDGGDGGVFWSPTPGGLEAPSAAVPAR